MLNRETWIWLPVSRYPDKQSCAHSPGADPATGGYAVAEFTKTYTLARSVETARIRFSGDTLVHLFCNGEVIATGPASVGGDFVGNERPRENFYAYELDIHPQTDELTFLARVQSMPVQICEYSRGHGGFMMTAELTFSDGSAEIISTDETWLARLNRGYTAPRAFDRGLDTDEFAPAAIVESILPTATAPIPVRTEEALTPTNHIIRLNPHEKMETVMDLDRIWAGYVTLRSEGFGLTRTTVVCRELEEGGTPETAVLQGEDEYRGFFLHSAGNLVVTCENLSDEPAAVFVTFTITHYPVCEEAVTVTGDEDLDRVLDTCKHTLRICRQTHHLDSPRHCEPLACTGDYYVESLMTPFSFGDMRLAEFDVLRTNVLLERENGRMFHTTYSLIWIRMLYETYLFTGNKSLLTDCKRGLDLLLSRFETYMGDNGLVENPPDYMFVDWIYIDGHSMHHPPKALGQTCLNLYLFAALKVARLVYTALEDTAAANRAEEKREALRKAIMEHLFDPDRRMFFEGLNTPTAEDKIYHFMPRNTDQRYYLKHSNILAAAFGVCDDETARDLVRRIMTDEISGDYQPYFAHFLFEAIYRLGLRKDYTRLLAQRWVEPTRECPKGLVEGFVVPEPGYGFDHSHAWGGTPLYSVPKALLGLEILRPGMSELQLSPDLLGLTNARVELLTPHGLVTCTMQEGKSPVVTSPEGVTVHIV